MVRGSFTHGKATQSLSPKGPNSLSMDLPSARMAPARDIIVIKSKVPFPPEAAVPMFDAMLGWIETNTKSGKIEQMWGFAGIQGGGGILDVESLEELDRIMVGMPFGPFSDVEVYGLADVRQGLQAGKEAVAMMMRH